MTTILILFALFILLILGFIIFNPTTTRIRKIQTLLNKDRSICDYINSLRGWHINNYEDSGLRIVIDPGYMPMYYLYITFAYERPDNDKIKELYDLLTNPLSPIQKAHELGIPYEEYAKQKMMSFFKQEFRID